MSTNMWKRMMIQRIADDLFGNGQGQEAERLMMISKTGKDLGGWCRQAVVDRITKALREDGEA